MSTSCSSRRTMSTLVTRSRATIAATTSQNGERRLAPLGILFLFLARDAEARVGEGVEPLGIDRRTTLVTVTELVGLVVQPAQRFVDVPEIAPFLRGEQELLFPFHGVRA